nr:MAG: capsid protein [Cressdnaviricota sp.]
MDSGAYGSYPKRSRRRFGVARYGAKRRSRSRVNPNKQFTFRKTRVGRLTKTDMQSLKATYSDIVMIPAGGVQYQFTSTGAAYLNLAAILAASPEFTSRVTQYSYYMLNGMSVTFTRQWIDPISYGVNGINPGFLQANYAHGLEMLNTNFYPNLLSTVVGAPTQQADSSWECSPFIHGAQKHYQPFPKNFTTGNNSNGLGVWNAANSYASISGELSIFNDGNAVAASDIENMYIWDVKIDLYVQFCNNTGA